MPTGYTPQSSIDRRKTLMNQLRQTPMNDTGKKTDWGRGRSSHAETVPSRSNGP